MARVTIDGRAFDVTDGRDLLETCLSLGLDLPYFCWHPALGSVGACRQCAVKQYRDDDDEKGKLVMACMTPANDGTRISIEDEEARSFRKSVIEWLMLNHPHDCPVCDEGGECHLQDMTVMNGHDVRRTRFPKRTFRNQDLGPFVNHEMNRCIECYRCVRFYREHAGGKDLAALAAHDHVYFGRVRDGKLQSEFSGNLVEICPTGVFTDKTLKKHYTRKWDLQSAPSICVHCGLGCNLDVAERYGKLRRVLNRFHQEVNGYFLCDRGRFGYEFNESERRLRCAFARRDGSLEPVGRAVALDALTEVLAGAKTVLGIGSPRASLESNYLLRRLVGGENFFLGVAERERALLARTAELLGHLPAASLGDVEASDAALVLGEDVTNVAPRMALALRQIHRNLAVRLAAEKKVPAWNDAGVREVAQGRKAPLLVATPFPTRLDDAASEIWRASPEDLARLGYLVAHELDATTDGLSDASAEESERAVRIATALREAERPVVVAGTTVGERALLDAGAAIVEALRRRGSSAKLAPVVPEANSLGVTLLGGGSMEAALSRARESRDGRERRPTLLVLENDLERRSPRSDVEALFEAAEKVVVLDSVSHGTTARADLLLPAATFAESEGTFVNNEGRAQRFFQVFVPDAEIQESWRWLAALGRERGNDSWRSLDDVLAALVTDYPALAGVVQAAPRSDFRLEGQRVPREPNRFSGRTAMFANVSIHEASTRPDPDSPLAFSMEGYPGRPPAALVPFVWSPRWNSVQAWNHYQGEVGEALQNRGAKGAEALLFAAKETADRSRDGFERPEGRFQPRDNEIRLWPFYEIFGSEELSALAPAIASIASSPFVVISPEDAGRLGLGPGDPVEISVLEERHLVTTRILPGVTPGSGGLSSGLGSLAGLPLPAWGRIERAP